MLKTDRPKVTIGLAVYNGEKLLPRAIEGWLGQDFKDFELNISDNCSTDRTEDICLDYCEKDDRINYFRFRKNLGMGHSFVRLAGTARGEYYVLAFHNDTFARDYLSSCLEVLDNDPSVVLCYAGTHLIDENGRSMADVTDKFALNQVDTLERYVQILSKLDLCNCFHGLMRTEAVQELLPYDQCAAGDVTFLAKMILKGKFFQVPRTLTFRNMPNHMACKSPADKYSQTETLGWPYLPYHDFNSLPFTDMIMALVNHICEIELDDDIKEKLIKATLEVWPARYRNNILYEVQNYLRFLGNGNVRHIWKNSRIIKNVSVSNPNLRRSYLIRRIQEMEVLINFFDKQADLFYIYAGLLSCLGRFEEAQSKVKIALNLQPDHQQAKLLLQNVQRTLAA